MKSKKLAFIIHRLQDKNFRGGGEKIMYNLIKQLCLRNYTVDVYCLETNIIYDLGINRIYFIESGDLYGEAMTIIQNKDYDDVISENINIPVDVTVAMGHSLAYREFVVSNFPKRFFCKFRKKHADSLLQIESAKKYSKILALSNIAKYDYVNFLEVDEQNIFVNYPGVDIVENPAKSCNPIFTFGLSAPGFDRKGGYIFLKALKILKKKNPYFKAKIIYPKYLKNNWVKFLLKLYKIDYEVEFYDFFQDMSEFYHNIDCLVVPSKEETFGMVATEAMADERHVITSSRCGASEIIKDGINGFVFDMDENPARNLAEKMEYVLANKDDISHISEDGYVLAKKYSWENFCNVFVRNLELEDICVI